MVFCVVFCFYVFPCLLGYFYHVFCVVPVLFVISMLFVALVLVFSFHYFLYVAIVNHKVWKPNHLSAYPITVLQLPAIKRLFAYQVCIRSTIISDPLVPAKETFHSFHSRWSASPLMSCFSMRAAISI